jgi:hypothetical protein
MASSTECDWLPTLVAGQDEMGSLTTSPCYPGPSARICGNDRNGPAIPRMSNWTKRDALLALGAPRIAASSVVER